MTYIKEDKTIYEVTTIKRVVDLEAMKAEVTSLETMTEPTDKELIEMGRMYHPYYMDKDRIPSLEDKIAEIELAVKEK